MTSLCEAGFALSVIQVMNKERCQLIKNKQATERSVFLQQPKIKKNNESRERGLARVTGRNREDIYLRLNVCIPLKPINSNVQNIFTFVSIGIEMK